MVYRPARDLTMKVGGWSRARQQDCCRHGTSDDILAGRGELLASPHAFIAMTVEEACDLGAYASPRKRTSVDKTDCG